MKKINIEYLGKVYEVNLSKINAFSNDVFKIEFEENPTLIEVMESPVYITEKPDRLSFPEVQNTEQIDLLMNFMLAIEENYSIISK